MPIGVCKIETRTHTHTHIVELQSTITILSQIMHVPKPILQITKSPSASYALFTNPPSIVLHQQTKRSQFTIIIFTPHILFKHTTTTTITINTTTILKQLIIHTPKPPLIQNLRRNTRQRYTPLLSPIQNTP
mmetsp:Transcript_6882/g.7964  ORF Transcript_6882/g.7964 Transcript_6882/m.7964 type:complete len:132 (+) Transcript_6882:8-403(+)